MPLRPRLERVREHGREDARGVTEPDAAEPRRGEPLDEVVHREVRGRRGEHLLAARRRAADHLDEHGRLPGAGRAVHEGEILGAIGEVERGALLGVQA